MTEHTAREWGHRYWDGSAAPDESREAALELAARFKPGCVEIVHRDVPDGEWQRASFQPHTPSQRLDALADYIELLREMNDWRGTRLVELGEHPNPPKAYGVEAPTTGHFSPGYRGETPNHIGRAESCAFPECRTAQRRREAAGAIQDITLTALAADGESGGAS
jgi:hypothetical protein